MIFVPCSRPSKSISQLLRTIQSGARVPTRPSSRIPDTQIRMANPLRSDVLPMVKGGAVVVACGLAASFLHPSSKLPGAWGHLSDVLGVTYTLAWSYSFYPQFVLNWRRKCDSRGMQESNHFCVALMVPLNFALVYIDLERPIMRDYNISRYNTSDMVN
jgi:hypothetical protein